MSDVPSGGSDEWQDLDAAESPETLLKFLDTFAKLPEVAEAKRRSFDLLDVHPGCRVLDAGCGTGVDVFALADRVMPGGEIVGVDSSAVAIEAASRQLDGRAGMHFERADMTALPFPTSHFDRARADRTLHHIRLPEVAVGELARVTRPGGRVVVSEALYAVPRGGRDQRSRNRNWEGLVQFLPFLLHRAGVIDIVIERSEMMVEPGPEVLAVLDVHANLIRIQFVHVAGVVDG